MFKKILKTVVISFIILSFFKFSILAKEDYILIVYDKYKSYGNETSELDFIIKEVLSLNKKLIVREKDNVNSKECREAYGIIILSSLEEGFKKEELEEIEKENSKIIYIETYLNEINEKEILNTIKEGFQINEYEAPIILLDEVYPYDDLNVLIEKVNYLYERGISFLVNANVVLSNTDSEAMGRYMEALRYCQSRGGRIVLGNPFIYNEDLKEESLIKAMAYAEEIFINYYVYPIALEVKDSYLYNSNRENYIKNSSSLILKEDSLDIAITGDYNFNSYDNVFRRVSLDTVLDYYDKGNFSNRVISLIGRDDINNFKENIDKLIKRNIPLRKAENLKSKLLFNNIVENGDNNITVNGDKVGIKKFINIEEFNSIFNEDSRKEENYSFSLKNVNRVIYIVSSISLVIFTIFFIKNRARDKEKYFK